LSNSISQATIGRKPFNIGSALGSGLGGGLAGGLKNALQVGLKGATNASGRPLSQRFIDFVADTLGLAPQVALPEVGSNILGN
jgi:hypothetical protein